MRIRTKIAIGTGTILSIGIASMAIIYGGLAQVRRALQQLTDVTEPIHTATHEMEINVNGMSLAVLNYRMAPSPRWRRAIEVDQEDFERFHASYGRLIATPRETALAGRVGGMYKEFKANTAAVIAAVDEQASTATAIDARFEEMDTLMDRVRSDRIGDDDPRRLEKREAVNVMEADLAEVGHWLAQYRRRHSERSRGPIVANRQEFLGALGRLEALGLTPEEGAAAEGLRRLFEGTMASLDRLIGLEHGLQRDLGRLIELREAIDELIDKEVQVLSRRDLLEPWREAQAATGRVLLRIGWLIPLFVLSGFATSAMLIRRIDGPVRLLIRGTRTVRAGDLGCRIDSTGRDEFAELAAEFNRMVARLQKTTVSKGLLEDSEHQLRENLDRMRAEIAERLRVEQERLRLQEAVQASEVEWRSTFDALDSLIIILDHEGRVTRMNRAADQLAVLRGEASAGRPVEVLGHGQPWEAAGELVRAVREERAVTSLQVRSEPDGRSWDVTVGRFAGAALEGGRILVKAREITRLVELQASLRRAETMTAMGELVAGVAHQVRNPLFGISSVLDAMDARFRGREEIGHYLDVLREPVDRLGGLMRELLEYAKPPGDGYRPGPIGEPIAEAVRVCGPLAARLGVRVECRIEPGLPPVEMDRTRMVRVFENLLENAIQHSPAGGEVAVTAGHGGEDGSGWIDCEVRDPGPGFRDEELGRAFDPFFTRRRGGTGLGLAIVQRIVDEHRGRVRAGNRAEGGAILSVRLPAAPARGGEVEGWRSAGS